MLQDRGGKPLEVGDKVTIPGVFTVSAVYEGADFYQVAIVRDVAGEQMVSLACQAKQLELVQENTLEVLEVTES